MGVLDIPAHRLLIRRAAAHEVLHPEEFHDTDESSHQEPVPNGNRRGKQRTPKLGRKTYGHHDTKRGNGIRRKRRDENLFYLYSLVDGLDPEDIHDDAELNMTAFGELFADPEKMRAWAEFVCLSEEDQQSLLQSNQQKNRSGDKPVNHVVDTPCDNPDFERMEENLQNFLRSEQLSQDALIDFEEDLIFTFHECLIDSLVLEIPSSFDRLIVHGLCQYMQLQAQTHKFKKKRLMEIENKSDNFCLPNQLLSDYLNISNL